ncbi:tRNA pseudouridine55 synthase [Desulfohalotomaculum tongense]|uniref:tRNA pseudouridine(55) synthase TruB n=1 Tax=Desulforadius tongensis TaxID=1216062 RepID=UPI0019589BD7|nr:tRNA pseudouridine(55) synthase TruB [Desulforadius tongensis]MBM7854442.1 tRNA pseudouridine55 synthase [Desulforadius tongensis]
MVQGGVLNILKPPGMTSHDVVNFIRKIFNTKKVGHTGTLDPAAAGVLPVCVGRATKIAQYIAGTDKTYRAEITLGITTDTQDAVGKILQVTDASAVKEEQFRQVLESFCGHIEQIPPMASAVKIGGKKLYQLQRQGKEVERSPRPVTIYNIKTVWSTGWGTKHPRVLFDVHCSKGTYVRTICNDIGNKLLVGAHMSFLLRISVGQFKIDDTYTLEELQQMSDPGEALVDMDTALSQYPEVLVKTKAVKSITSGAKLYPPGVLRQPDQLPPGQLVRLKDGDTLLALAVTQYERQPMERVVFKPVCQVKING